MIIKPKTRGFICTTAHPAGCAANVEQAAARAAATPISNGPKGVLVVGSSTGYGLASRITAAFGCGAATVGVFLEKPSSGQRTASAGWYNNAAFERLAADKGLAFQSINGDAFSSGVKDQAAEAIRSLPGGQVDLVVYSLAAPRRTDEQSGQSWSSVLKPVGQAFHGKTVDFHTGEVSPVEIGPATQEEIDGTVAVMGGSDWLEWIRTLQEGGVLAENALTIAFSYLGPELTHSIYKDGTIGRAKEDLEEKAREIDKLLAPEGKAFVSVNKALVTQASAAIPVVPLYISILFRKMKERGTHEDCTDQIIRLFRDRLYGSASSWSGIRVDEAGRIRMDDLEMEPGLQEEIAQMWDQVDTASLEGAADLPGYRDDFFRLFGFCVDGVDYEADVEI